MAMGGQVSRAPKFTREFDLAPTRWKPRQDRGDLDENV